MELKLFRKTRLKSKVESFNRSNPFLASFFIVPKILNVKRPNCSWKISNNREKYPKKRIQKKWDELTNITIILHTWGFATFYWKGILLISQFQANPNSGNEAKQDESVYGIIKHPLQHSWTLWYLEPDRSKSWELNLNKVSTFNTVEDFWSLFNHIKQPSEVKMGSDYSLFKEGVRPMWEDPANKQGGRWVISLNRGQRLELDRYWIDTVRLLFFDWGKFKDYFYLTIFIIK